MNSFSNRIPVFIAVSLLVLFHLLGEDVSTYLKSAESDVWQRVELNYNTSLATEGSSFRSMGSVGDFSEFQDVTLMHVGKTGGTTLRNYVFRISCTAIVNTEKRSSCLDTITPNESVLSKRTTGFVHYDHIHPEDILETSKVFLYTVRDPVARFVSLFRFQSPENCFPELGAKNGCLMRKRIQRHPDTPEAKYYAYCFPTLPYVFAALGDPLSFRPAIASKVNASECLQLLQEGFQLANATSIYGHLEANYRYYWRLIEPLVEVKTILAVRTEFLWKDTSELDRLLGGSGDFAALQNKKVSHGSESYALQSNFSSGSDQSDLEYRLLCCALWSDMVAYRQIIDSAANLNPLDKEETYKITLERCGVSNWVQLEENCLVTQGSSPFWKPLLQLEGESLFSEG